MLLCTINRVNLSYTQGALAAHPRSARVQKYLRVGLKSAVFVRDNRVDSRQRTLLTSRPGDIVIIENPEAHLHPKGQAKMGELLARAAAYGVQLFVETHSDHVINGIRVAVADKLIQPADVNIAFFERGEHGVPRDDGSVGTETYAEVCNVKVDGKGALSEYPEGFMDEWGNQLLELL